MNAENTNSQVALGVDEALTKGDYASNNTADSATPQVPLVTSYDSLPMVFSHLPTVTGDVIEQYNPSWVEVREMLSNPATYSSKKECPLFKLATFCDQRTSAGSLRSDDNINLIYGVVADYDGELISVDDATAMLDLAGIEAIIYTSASHVAAAPRWRVVAPLSVPCSKDNHRILVGILNSAMGGILAPESFNLSLSYYYGRVDGALFESRYISGYPLDNFELVLDPLYPSNENGSVAPTKSLKVAAAISNDPVAQFLIDQKLVKRKGSEGKLFIDCPNKAEHTMDSALYPTITDAPATSAPVASTAGMSMAERMYATPTPSPVAVPAPQVAQSATPAPVDDGYDYGETDTETATPEQVVYDIPDNIKELRRDPARLLNGDAGVAFKSSIRDTAMDDPRFAPAGSPGELREMAADMALTTKDIPLFDKALGNVPTTPELVIAQRESAVAMLNRTYGVQATEVLNLARQYIAQDPRRAMIMQHVGDSPDIVMRVVELARRARINGTL